MKSHANPAHAYWEKQSPDVKGMMLNSNAEEFEQYEREEVLHYLPKLDQLDVVELAAGIGRFTGILAKQAKHLTAVEFVGSFLEENHKKHKHLPNIDYIHSDVMLLERPEGSADFVFINWLMMYLTDEDANELIGRIHRWLRPQGRFFFRESCVSPSNPKAHHPHSYYRQPDLYEEYLQARFDILTAGNIKIYEHKYNNPNQRWWLCQKK